MANRITAKTMRTPATAPAIPGKAGVCELISFAAPPTKAPTKAKKSPSSAISAPSTIIVTAALVTIPGLGSIAEPPGAVAYGGVLGGAVGGVMGPDAMASAVAKSSSPRLIYESSSRRSRRRHSGG